MLGSLDNIVNAGIRFETDLRGVDRAESKLDSLYEQMKQTGAGGVILGEGTDKANRSLKDTAVSAGTASGGLAGLQSQLASTRAAQEALEDSSGDLSSSLRNLDSDAQDMVVSDIVGELTGNLDDLDDAPKEFSLDNFVKGEDEVEQLVRSITDLNDAADESILGGQRDSDLPEMEAVSGMDETIQAFSDEEFGDIKYEQIFGKYGETKVQDFPLNPRSDAFPDDVDRMDAHVFDQINRNSEFDTFMEMMNADGHPRDFMNAASFPGNTERNIDNIDGDGTALFSDEITNSLNEKGINTADQFFRSSDADLADVIEGTVLGDNGITPDELRASATDQISRQTISDKDMSDLGFEESGAIGVGMDNIKKSRTSASSPTDLFPKIDGMPEEDEALKEAANNLAFIMDEYDEINTAVQGSDNLHQARNKLAELDGDGLVKLNRWVDENRESLAESIGNTDDVVRRLGAVEDPKEFHRMLRNEGGFSSDGEAETIANMMGDLDPSLLKGQGRGKGFPITRETLGLRAFQEMMDTDPESDRQDTLQSIVQSIYHPEEGIQQTLLDDEQLMKGGFYEGLRDELPDHLTTPGGFDENNVTPGSDEEDELTDEFGKYTGDSKRRDVAREVTEEFFGGDETKGMGIEDFIGEDSENIGELVSRAVNKFDYNDPEVLKKSSRKTEEFLPSVYEMYASQLAPGMNTSARASDSDITSLFPGQAVLDPPEGRDGEITPEFETWMDQLEKDMNKFRKAQDSSGVLRGGALAGLFGDDGDKKGLFGALSDTFARSDMGTPRRVEDFNAGLDKLEKSFKRLNPLLSATSFNLGPLNVNFEGAARMAFKLTATLGPLIVALGGLAGAAVTATGALAGFIGAGALNFFEDMEDSMAGVTDKQDAMEALAGTLAEMGKEALMPLRMARIGGDGNTAAQSFVEVLRGGLQILNRAANVFAYLMELEVVGDQAERISNFLLNSDGDAEFAKQLATLVTAVLPVLNDMIIAILGNMGGFAEYASRISKTLGGELMNTLGNLKPILSLLTSYGAGFFTYALRIISVMSKLAMVIVVPMRKLAELINYFTGGTLKAEDFMFAIGGLIGSITVLGGVASYVSASLFALSGTFVKVAKFASLLTTANYGLASSFAIVASTVGLLFVQFWLLKDAIQRIDDLDPELSIDFAKDIGIIATELAAAAAAFAAMMKGLGAFAGLATILTNIAGYLGISSATILTIKSILGVITASTVGWAAVIAGIAIVLGDIAFWLATGETLLINWDDHLESIADKWDSINEDASEHFARVREHALFGGTGNNGTGEKKNFLARLLDGDHNQIPNTGGSTAMATGGGGFGITSAHVKALGFEAAETAINGGSTSSTTTRSSQNSSQVEVHIDQSMSNKEIARIAKREIASWWNKEMR